MTTLLLRLAGPMQSWGTQSRFTQRETGLEPSKSGVIGLLAAALGIGRDETGIIYGGTEITLAMLAALPMAVRVEREGSVERDYHTAGGWHLRADEQRKFGVAQAGGGVRTVESERFYLADADFLVGLQGERGILALLHAALDAPHWQLSLGRKAFVPALPVAIPDDPRAYGPALRDEPLWDVMCKERWRVKREGEETPAHLRLVLDTELVPEDEDRRTVVRARRQDVPVSFAIAQREYGVRIACITTITTPGAPAPPMEGDDPDVSLTAAR